MYHDPPLVCVTIVDEIATRPKERSIQWCSEVRVVEEGLVVVVRGIAILVGGRSSCHRQKVARQVDTVILKYPVTFLS